MAYVVGCICVMGARVALETRILPGSSLSYYQMLIHHGVAEGTKSRMGVWGI